MEDTAPPPGSPPSTPAQTIILMNGASGVTAGIDWWEVQYPTGEFVADYDGTTDNYLRDCDGGSSYSNYNYGAADWLAVGRITWDERSLYKFDLSELSLPDSSLLEKAELVLYCNRIDTTAEQLVDIFRIDGAWAEGSSNNAAEIGASCTNYRAYNTVNWSNTAESGLGGDFYDRDANNLNETDSPYASQTVYSNGPYKWDITDLTAEWLADTYDNEGVLLKSNVTSGYRGFYSREYVLGETTHRRPALVLTYAAGPVCGDNDHPIPVGDLDEDCHVRLSDLGIYVLHWLECTAPECD